MNKTEVVIFHAAETPIGTSLWISEKVFEFFTGDEISDVVKLEKMIRRIRFLCDANLRVHMPDTVKREYGKTYCIHLDQYRIVGFFDQSYRDFIAVDYFVKKTQKNDKRMNAIYKRVDQIREAGTWIKVD